MVASHHHKQIKHSPLPGITEQDSYLRFLDGVTLSSEQLHVEGEGKLLTSTKLATADCLLEFVWNLPDWMSRKSRILVSTVTDTTYGLPAWYITVLTVGKFRFYANPNLT
jgi:hypothetical protein